MRKFQCYKPDNSKFGVAFYVKQASGLWYGFDEYGDCVRTEGKYHPYLTDFDVLSWLHSGRGELVNGPTYKQKFTPKLYFNAWEGRVWYVLFTKENEKYCFYLVGEKDPGSPVHQTHSSYVAYSNLIKPVWGDKWIWKEITDSSKESLMKMVIEKGK